MRLLALTCPAVDVLLLVFALRLVLAGSADLRTCLLLTWAGLRTAADSVWSSALLQRRRAGV